MLTSSYRKAMRPFPARDLRRQAKPTAFASSFSQPSDHVHSQAWSSQYQNHHVACFHFSLRPSPPTKHPAPAGSASLVLFLFLLSVLLATDLCLFAGGRGFVSYKIIRKWEKGREGGTVYRRLVSRERGAWFITEGQAWEYLCQLTVVCLASSDTGGFPLGRGKGQGERKGPTGEKEATYLMKSKRTFALIKARLLVCSRCHRLLIRSC